MALLLAGLEKKQQNKSKFVCVPLMMSDSSLRNASKFFHKSKETRCQTNSNSASPITKTRDRLGPSCEGEVLWLRKFSE